METEGYDVLRLIEHGKLCYVSSDHVQGKPMMQWLKYNPNISKKILLTWMQELVIQLGLFHKVRGEPCYMYVNPFSLVVCDDEKIYLLDMGADSNQKVIRQMQRRSVRESFLPEGESFYQSESIQLDIYGIGRTMQYLLSVTDPDPVLSKKEELKLRKIISKCLQEHSKKPFQTIQDIQKYFPLWSQKKSKKEKGNKKRIVALLLGIVIVLGVCFRVIGYKHTEEKPKKNVVEQREKNQERISNKEEELEFKMGLLYLLETQEYERSYQCFQKIQNSKLAGAFLNITQWMSGNKAGNMQLFKESLDYVKENIPKDQGQECRRILVRGYMQLDTKEAAGSIVHIGNEILKEGGGEGDLDESIESEIHTFMAAAYEELGEMEQAVKLYEKQLEVEEGTQEKEGLYKKITLLYETLGQTGRAGEFCQKGMEEFPESLELRLLHVGLLCRNKGVERAVCAQTIQQYLHEMPQMAEQEEFEKLKREYDIKVEGEQVWVGK